MWRIERFAIKGRRAQVAAWIEDHTVRKRPAPGMPGPVAYERALAGGTEAD